MLLGITSKSVQHETSFSLFKEGLCPLLVAYLVGVFFFFDKQNVTNKKTRWTTQIEYFRSELEILKEKIKTFTWERI